MSKGDFKQNAFKDLEILVLGDAMIDRYYYGNIDRQSPEANVPIVDVGNIEFRLGGAANVALNIVQMGAKAHLMSFQGNDDNGKLLKSLLVDAEICNNLLASNRRTTVKTRVYNGDEYVFRYDIEDVKEMADEELELLLKRVELVCQNVPLNVIIFQDYNKGYFTKKSISALLNVISKYDIPVAVDPKEHNFFDFKSVQLFKPNLKEVNSALNLSLTGENEMDLKNACMDLISKLSCENVLLTAAQHGAVVCGKDEFYSVKAHKRKVVDVSGAGDTVIAMASLLLALQLPLNKILEYSNLAGGLVIEERGVKALSLKEWEKAVL